MDESSTDEGASSEGASTPRPRGDTQASLAAVAKQDLSAKLLAVCESMNDAQAEGFTPKFRIDRNGLSGKYEVTALILVKEF